jgi:hypothetical protein
MTITIVSVLPPVAVLLVVLALGPARQSTARSAATEKSAMRQSATRLGPLRRLSGGLGLLVTLWCTGCQVDIGGQTLPSPYWQTDDVQYFPAGPEFKLSREAAAMRAFTEEQAPVGVVAEPVPPAAAMPALPPGVP